MNAEEKIAVTKLDCSDGSMAKIDFDENMQPNDDQLPSSLTKSL
jgi:hypothetical protein